MKPNSDCNILMKTCTKSWTNFWNGPEEIRTCKETGKVIHRAGEFSLDTAQPIS